MPWGPELVLDCVTGQGTARAGLIFGLLVCPCRLGCNREAAERACVTRGYMCQRLQLEAITVTSRFSGYTRLCASTDDRRL